MIDTDKYGHTDNWSIRYYEPTRKHEIITDGKEERVCVLQYSAGWKEYQEKNAQLIADAPLLLEAYKRLREALVGDSKDWTTDELVEKALTLYDKALVFDTIYDWYERMQLQSESYENKLWRMDWLLKNPTKEYEDYDKEYDEE